MYLTDEDARELLRQRVAEAGSQEKFAAGVPCSHTLISRVLANGAPVGRRIAAALGLVAIPVRSFQYMPADAREKGV